MECSSLCQAADDAYRTFEWTHRRNLEDTLNDLGDTVFNGWRYKRSNCGAPWYKLMTVRADQFEGEPLLQDLAQCIEWLAAHSLDRHIHEKKTEDEHFKMEHILRTNIARMQREQDDADKDLLTLRNRLLEVEGMNTRLKKRLQLTASQLRRISEGLPSSSISSRITNVARELEETEGHVRTNSGVQANPSNYCSSESCSTRTTDVRLLPHSDRPRPAEDSRVGPSPFSRRQQEREPSLTIRRKQHVTRLPSTDPPPAPASPAGMRGAQQIRPPRPPPTKYKAAASTKQSGGINSRTAGTGSQSQTITPLPSSGRASHVRRPSLSQGNIELRGRDHQRGPSSEISGGVFRTGSQGRAADLKFRMLSRRTSLVRSSSCQEEGENIAPLSMEEELFNRVQVDKPPRGICRRRAEKGGCE